MVTTVRCKPRSITAARQVVLKAMCEMPDLVSTQVADLTELITLEYVAKLHACMTGKDIIHIYPRHLFMLPSQILAWLICTHITTRKLVKGRLHTKNSLH